jgi:hypothetical protein
MSTAAQFWTTQFTRFQVTVAAVIVAVAAVLTPAAIAQAKPDLLPTLPTTPLTDVFGTDPILSPVSISSETPYWWLTDNNNSSSSGIGFKIPGASLSLGSSALPGNIVFYFAPLALVPGFLRPLAGWFLNLLPQASICFLGLGASFGPYGTITVKTGAC